MEDFKVVLYVVLGIGYFVYNMYKKLNVNSKRKPQPRENQKQRPTSQRSVGENRRTSSAPGKAVKPKVGRTIEEILAELQGQGHARHEMPKAEEVVLEPVFNEGVDNAEEFKSDEGVSAVVDRLRREREEIRFNQAKKEGEEIGSIPEFNFASSQGNRSRRKRFDLKKAIIYDAILKRPQY